MKNINNKKKIAFFGGSFDPFTIAHKNIVEKACKELVDEVIIVPTAVDWYRKDKKPWLTKQQKINTICEVMGKTDDDVNWGYDPLELEFAEFTQQANFDEFEKEKFINNHGFYDTLIKLETDYLNHYEFSGDYDVEFYFIIGTDQCKFFKQWRNWEYIIKHAKMIVVQGREGEHVDIDIPHETLTIDPKYADISASKLREEWMPKGYDEFISWVTYEYAYDWSKKDIIAETPIFNVVEGPTVKKPFDSMPHKNDGPYGFVRDVFKPIRIEAPNWASIIVEKDGKYLMVEQFRYGINDMSTEFPCGMVEKNEPAICAAIRELAEETGYKINIGDVTQLGSFSPNPAFMTNHMYYFYVNLDAIKYELVDTKFDKNEDIKHKWIDKDIVEHDLMSNHNSSVLMVSALTLLKHIKIIV